MPSRRVLTTAALLAALSGCGSEPYNTLPPEKLQVSAPRPAVRPALKKARPKPPPSYLGRMEVGTGIK